MKKLPVFLTLPMMLILVLSFTMPAFSAEPKRFFIDFMDAYLVYVPSSGTKQVVAEGNVLSYGGDWEVRALKPYLYHMRLKTWKGFYWKVNTSRKEVYQVTGGTFGQLGGSDKKKNFNVNVVGGGGTGTPDRFLIKFPDAYLVYVPGSGTLQIAAGGNVLSYGSGWEVKKLKSYLFHMRLNTWKGFYWKINTSRKEAYLVRNGAFGELGGSETKMKSSIRVVQ